jgi:hypothetical protein
MSAMTISTPLSASKPPLRLTRRGRFVFMGIPAVFAAAALALSAMAVMIGVFANPANASTVSDKAPASYAMTVTVLQGDSLWSLAAKADPSRDPRDVVSDIVVLNELHGGVIHPGQKLFVPVEK